MVSVVVATEREGEPVDRDAIELSRVAICLFDLADQGTVHRRIPPALLGPSRGRARSMHLPTGEAVVCLHDTPPRADWSPPKIARARPPKVPGRESSGHGVWVSWRPPGRICAPGSTAPTC